MPIDWVEIGNIQQAESIDLAFSGLGKEYVAGEGDFGVDSLPQVFVVGEAPGAIEVMQERPFVGPSGGTLRQLMALAGLYAVSADIVERSYVLNTNTWLTNVVKFRPPGNRTPTDWEIKAGRRYLRREWVAVGCPEVVICIGGTACRAVVGRPISVLKYAGELMGHRSNHTGSMLTVVPMIHPAYGLRNEESRRSIELHWQALHSVLFFMLGIRCSDATHCE